MIPTVAFGQWTYTDLGNFLPQAINDRGEVVGSVRSPGSEQAYFWSMSGGLQAIGTPSLGLDSQSRAVAINRQGTVLVQGWSAATSIPASLGFQPFFWRSGQGFEPLGPLPTGAVAASLLRMNDAET